MRSPAEPATTMARVAGWGRATASRSRVARPHDDADWHDRIASAGPRGLIARGGGCSYGDAAQNAGGVVALTTDGPLGFAVEGDTVVADAGVRLGDLVRVLAGDGWTLPVVPGTGHVTVGGAIAADVHGKNHVHRGTFGAHVRELTLLTPGRGLITAGPDADPDAFWATVGGLGLTGVIRRATLGLVPLGSWTMCGADRVVDDLDAMLHGLREAAERQPYAVAWIDARRRGRRTGGGVITTAAPADPPGGTPGPPRTPRIGITLPGPGIGVAPIATTANRARWAMARARPRQRLDLPGVLFPLDPLSGWPGWHGRRGLVQYQFAVPFGAEAVLAAALVDTVRIGRPATLAALKVMGASGPAPLSFPMPGWSLALDFPADPALAPVLDRLDERVAAAGGRVYLVKDSRLRPDVLEQMYPQLPRWRAERAVLDPDQVMVSDLSRRLNLTGAAGEIDA